MSNETAAPSPSEPGSPVPPGGAVPPGAMRVSDTERNSAIEALGEHLSAGRITLDEYGDRSAKVTVAKTAGDLSDLFDDLPHPHPMLPESRGAAALSPASPAGGGIGVPGSKSPARAGGDERSTAQKIVGAAAAASVFVALVLFFVTGSWYWFLMIPAISAIAGSIWGPDWKDPGGGNARRRVRGDRRDRRRELGS